MKIKRSTTPAKSARPRLPSADFPSKRRGEIAELAFLLKTASLGISVSKPYGDSHPYDFIVHAGRRFRRVQVKSTHQPRGNGYALTVQHMTSNGGPHYTALEIDIMVAYVVPADAWYIIPLTAFLPRRQLRLYPDGCRCDGGTFEKYREAWHLLTQDSWRGHCHPNPPRFKGRGKTRQVLR